MNDDDLDWMPGVIIVIALAVASFAIDIDWVLQKLF